MGGGFPLSLRSVLLGVRDRGRAGAVGALGHFTQIVGVGTHTRARILSNFLLTTVALCSSYV